MKNGLLTLTALLILNFIDAQKHIATPMRTKGVATFSKNFSTQGILAACDTLKIDSARNLWSPVLYLAAADGSLDDGYVTGVSNNIDEDGNGLTVLEDANYYDVSNSDYNYITGGFVNFKAANSNVNADLDKDLVFKVYADAGGLPGALLGSTSVAFNTVKNDVDDSALTIFKFSSPVQIPANKIFYISVDHSNLLWNGTTRDSLAIVSDSNNQAPQAAYQYVSLSSGDVNWYTTSFIWNDTAGNDLDINLYLFPFVSNAINGCATLPVSLFNFRGSLTSKQAELTWNTAFELNNKGFEVQRSNDGKLFTDVGFVKGAGTTSSLKKYSYTDAALNDLNNTFYYRLKQIDFDGKISYSKIILLSTMNIADLKIYPNPVKDNLTVQLNLTTNAKVSVQIISKDGKLLLNEDKGRLVQGSQQLSLNLKNIPAGSYFVRVKAGADTYLQNIIRQ